MAGEWYKLRAFDGSVENAFEELCAQLARIDAARAGHRFVRNGKPDGGLECYAVQTDGGIIGWQAKFFTSALNDSQWGQITKSFKQALSKYPALSKFIVCLPLDRGTSRAKKRLPMEKWEAHVRKWSNVAGAKRPIAFDYWGTSEIFDRLSAADQGGRLKFWFDGEFFTPAWFRQRFDEAHANNRRKYRPDLNVGVAGIDRAFEPLLQTPRFVDDIRARLAKLYEIVTALDRAPQVDRSQEAFATLLNAVQQIPQGLDDLPRSAEGEIDENVIRGLVDAGWAFVRTQPGPPSKEADSWRYYYQQLGDLLYPIGEAVAGTSKTLRCKRSLFLVGDAGQGKTHTLLGLADRRTQAGFPVVLGFGINFVKGDPWLQLISSLGHTCNRDEFLGALNAAGEAKQARALIILDALNDSEEPSVWQSTLPGMLQAIEPYPFVAIACSVRRDFLFDIIPRHMIDSGLHVEHPGFRGQEAEAASRIFSRFGIVVPQVPLLDPEFANPLFVITLAEALQGAGLTAIPHYFPGGIRWLFELWLSGINDRLSAHARLDFDAGEGRVERAVKTLAEKMKLLRSRWLEEQTAKTALDAVHPSTGWSTSMLRALMDEEVVERVKIYQLHSSTKARKRQAGPIHAVRFTYDRMTDHWIAKHLLTNATSKARLKTAFKSRRVREQLGHPGLMRALAVEIAEDDRFRCELSEIIPEEAVATKVNDAMFDSIAWRSTHSIGKAIVAVARQRLRSAAGAPFNDQRDLIGRSLCFATRSTHPLNAEFLASELRRVPMRNRDYWWARPLTEMDRPAGSVMRLIEWIRSPTARQTDDETARLAAITGFWLFATSNRFIRDRATRALVSMLIDRPAIVAELLSEFLTVDDPYVVERAFAVAYGVALRTREVGQLRCLGKLILDRCFTSGELPVHLLTRDYARGIVDVAARRAGLQLQPSVIEPPYRSDWPEKITPWEEWEQRATKSMDNDRSVLKMWSFLKDGDHRINTCPWLRYRLSDEIPSELCSDSKDVVMSLIEAHSAAKDDPIQNPFELALPTGPVAQPKTASGRRPTHYELSNFANMPLSQLKAMIMDDAFSLGYCKRLDENVQSHYQDGTTAGPRGEQSETIWRKYLWIATRRSQARLADRFTFNAVDQGTGIGSYHGPWQLDCGRDIDPSCLISAKAHSEKPRDLAAWWAPFRDTKFEDPMDDDLWIEDRSNVPSSDELVRVQDPDGEWWIVVSIDVSQVSERPMLPAVTWRRRRIWHQVESILVRAAESNQVVSWVSKCQRLEPGRPFMSWLNRPRLDKCFLGEFPNSKTWDAENTPYYHRSAWATPEANWYPPVPFARMTDGYFEDSELDCGRDEVIDFRLPSAELIRGLDLRQSYQDGHFLNAVEHLVAWDPSITQPGPSALLVNQRVLAEYLKAQDLHLALLVYGEKVAHADSTQQTKCYGELHFFGTSLFNGNGWSGSLKCRSCSPGEI